VNAIQEILTQALGAIGKEDGSAFANVIRRAMFEAWLLTVDC